MKILYLNVERKTNALIVLYIERWRCFDTSTEELGWLLKSKKKANAKAAIQHSIKSETFHLL